MADIATASTKQKAFLNLGNLAFYDGWHSDYIYFKTLANAHVTFGLKKGPSPWDGETADSIADMAIKDAQAHANLHQMSDEESITYFLKQFEQISAFLEQAIQAEEASENAYLTEKIKSIKQIFTREEIKQINEIQRLEDALVEAKDGTQVPIDKINTLINVIQYGVKNTRTLINYEQDRIEKLTEMLEKFVHSRGNQAAGLGKKFQLSDDKIEEMRERAEKKYTRAVTQEYVKTGQLSRKENDEYVLWGAATIKKEIPKAMDRIFADWLNETLEIVVNDKNFVNKIAEKMQKNMPVNGNFNLLYDDVKEAVIQAVITSGLHNLADTLAKNTSARIIRRVKRQLLKDDGLLDAAYEYDIAGLESFGMMSTEPALFKETTSLAESKTKSAEKLYEKTKALIEKEKKYVHGKSYKSDSYLIRAMGQTRSTNRKELALERVDNIMTMISEIEGLDEELKKARTAWLRSKTSIREVKLNKNSKAKVIITIENGKPMVNMESLVKALNQDNRFKSFGFKGDKINPQGLRTALIELKARASKVLKQEIISSLEQANLKIPEDQLLHYVREELRALTIHINGPYLLEVLPTLSIKQISKQKVFVEWNNYKGKNDSIEILISSGKVKTQFENTNFYQGIEDILKPAKQRLEYAQQALLREYQATIDTHVKKLTEDNDAKKYSKMIEVMETEEKKDKQETEELTKARKELKDATENYIAEIRKQYKLHGEYGDINDKMLTKLSQEYLDTLKNSFYVSTTTKSRNEYVNQLGFNGGSLGPNLDSQLSRISDIFSSAGVPIDEGDLKWLKSAILNCFPGSVIGEKNKTLIENYIGSLAAFALFDEGAVEANIVDNFKADIVTAIKKNQAQKIVHLYLVDGIYVKGSTVLRRTLNTIQNEVIPNIQKIPDTMRKGAGVIIINNTTEEVIPNRPKRNYYNSADPNAWAKASSNAQKGDNISIKILFLAGLLDIIHSINATLSQVEH